MGTTVTQDEIQTTKLGYASVTATQAVNSTAETDVTGLSVAVTVPPGGRDVKITALMHASSAGGVGPFAVHIKEGATTLQNVQGYLSNTTNAFSFMAVTRISAPAAGAHTYKVSGTLPTATSGFYADASGYTAYILVELL